MADTFTKRLNLTKPEVGASRDAWGGKWNDNVETIDKSIFPVDWGAAAGDYVNAKWGWVYDPATGNMNLKYVAPDGTVLTAAYFTRDGNFYLAKAGTFLADIANKTQLIGSSLGNSAGYRRWSDGSIEQWGFITIPQAIYVSFPIVFPNACRAICLTPSGFNPDLPGCQVDEVSPNRFRAYARTAANGGAVSAATFPAYYYARGF